MAPYGYARVSTLDQELTVQREALLAAGYGVIRARRPLPAGTMAGPTELQVLLPDPHLGIGRLLAGARTQPFGARK